METRIALIGIIMESTESVEQLNHLLHEYGSHIIGRMGIPYREKNVHIISVAIDAPQDVKNSLVGLPVAAHKSCTVDCKYHRQVLNTDIVENLVVRPLQEGRIHRKDRL